ncbi:hypothetical protein G9A89_010518 [Geosiphon pyriformis]|nr:hypothetical protein G9A89_010518 [Geosiphon pyriformis]
MLNSSNNQQQNVNHAIAFQHAETVPPSPVKEDQVITSVLPNISETIGETFSGDIPKSENHIDGFNVTQPKNSQQNTSKIKPARMKQHTTEKISPDASPLFKYSKYLGTYLSQPKIVDQVIPSSSMKQKISLGPLSVSSSPMLPSRTWDYKRLITKVINIEHLLENVQDNKNMCQNCNGNTKELLGNLSTTILDELLSLRELATQNFQKEESITRAIEKSHLDMQKLFKDELSHQFSIHFTEFHNQLLTKMDNKYQAQRVHLEKISHLYSKSMGEIQKELAFYRQMLDSISEQNRSIFQLHERYLSELQNKEIFKETKMFEDTTKVKQEHQGNFHEYRQSSIGSIPHVLGAKANFFDNHREDDVGNGKYFDVISRGDINNNTQQCLFLNNWPQPKVNMGSQLPSGQIPHVDMHPWKPSLGQFNQHEQLGFPLPVVNIEAPCFRKPEINDCFELPSLKKLSDDRQSTHSSDSEKLSLQNISQNQPTQPANIINCSDLTSVNPISSLPAKSINKNKRKLIIDEDSEEGMKTKLNGDSRLKKIRNNV